MNPDADRQLFRRLGLVVAALLMVALTSLSSCGPGVVGTGTGAPVPSADAALCGSEFSSSLSCGGTADNGADPGTAPVVWSDAAARTDGASVVIRLTGHRLELEEPCTQLRYDGRWSLLEDGSYAFAGSWTDALLRDPQPGFVTVRADAVDPSLLELRLVDAAGALRHGPWFVRRGDAVPAVAACSGSGAEQ
jgi:hypothetical protein